MRISYMITKYWLVLLMLGSAVPAVCMEGEQKQQQQQEEEEYTYDTHRNTSTEPPTRYWRNDNYKLRNDAQFNAYSRLFNLNLISPDHIETILCKLTPNGSSTQADLDRLTTIELDTLYTNPQTIQTILQKTEAKIKASNPWLHTFSTLKPKDGILCGAALCITIASLFKCFGRGTGKSVLKNTNYLGYGTLSVIGAGCFLWSGYNIWKTLSANTPDKLKSSGTRPLDRFTALRTLVTESNRLSTTYRQHVADLKNRQTDVCGIFLEQSIFQVGLPDIKMNLYSCLTKQINTSLPT